MISAQGTIIRRNGLALEDLGNIEPPPLARKALDKTRRGESDEVFQVGRRQAGALVFDIAYTPALLPLITAWSNGTLDSYEVIFTDGATWTFQGYVESVVPQAPVDDKLHARVLVQSTDAIVIDGEVLLAEDGTSLLLEDGGVILL